MSRTWSSRPPAAATRWQNGRSSPRRWRSRHYRAPTWSRGVHAADWNQALRTLAVAVPDDRPSIAVLDEVPWLVEQDGEFEGALQTVWDRYLSAKPVLLLLVGSDLSVMEALQTYGRPFFGRAATMPVRPLHVADIADMTGLGAADAIDALLITGGFPRAGPRLATGNGPCGIPAGIVDEPAVAAAGGG